MKESVLLVAMVVMSIVVFICGVATLIIIWIFCKMIYEEYLSEFVNNLKMWWGKIRKAACEKVKKEA